MAKNKQLSNLQEVISKNNPLLTLQQEQRLYKLHEEKHIGAFDQYKSCENMVVLGNPACGRSTVGNSLLGHKLTTCADEYGMTFIDVVDPKLEKQFKISHNSIPGQETLTPVSVGDITIWECTGLYNWVGTTKDVKDVGPPIEEAMKMRESPIIMQLLKTVNSVKFIFVADYHDLTPRGSRGEDFLATVDLIASIFSDLERIKESMLLVITKAPSFETQEGVVKMIEGAIKWRDMSDHTKTLMKYLKESSIHIFYKPEKVGEEVVGPTLELIENLPFCDVSKSIQYPCLSPPNQELALEILAEDDARIQQEEKAQIQDEVARKQLEQAGVDTTNISNTWFFIKVVDFLYEALASMSILTKAGQYAGGVLIALSSLISVNKLKGYFSSDKMEAVSAKDESPQPMSREKAKLAKCLVKMLNEDKALSKKINEKFDECIEKYTKCQNDEEKQIIAKQFSEWIISETNLKNELLTFEAESHISDENYNSSEKSSSGGESGGQTPLNPSDPNQPGKGKPGGNGHELANTVGINNSSKTQLTHVNSKDDEKPDGEVMRPEPAHTSDINNNRETQSNNRIVSLFNDSAVLSESAQKFGNSFIAHLTGELDTCGDELFVPKIPL